MGLDMIKIKLIMFYLQYPKHSFGTWLYVAKCTDSFKPEKDIE